MPVIVTGFQQRVRALKATSAAAFGSVANQMELLCNGLVRSGTRDEAVDLGLRGNRINMRLSTWESCRVLESKCAKGGEF